MWVRVAEWMIVDDEPPRPDPGSVLRSVGVRAHGTVKAARSATPEQVVESLSAATADPVGRVYELTGVAGVATAIPASSAPRRRRLRRSGKAEFVLTVGGDRLQVQFDGRLSDVLAGSPVTVTGALVLVGHYEWEAFDLVDTRADWIVRDVVASPSGDIAVDLARSPGDDSS